MFRRLTTASGALALQFGGGTASLFRQDHGGQARSVATRKKRPAEPRSPSAATAEAGTHTPLIGKGRMQNMCFSKTNPPIFEWKNRVIDLRWNGLRGNNLSSFGGFVFQNEPTGRGILRNFDSFLAAFTGKSGPLGRRGAAVVPMITLAGGESDGGTAEKTGGDLVNLNRMKGPI